MISDDAKWKFYSHVGHFKRFIKTLKFISDVLKHHFDSIFYDATLLVLSHCFHQLGVQNQYVSTCLNGEWILYWPMFDPEQRDEVVTILMSHKKNHLKLFCTCVSVFLCVVYLPVTCKMACLTVTVHQESWLLCFGNWTAVASSLSVIPFLDFKSQKCLYLYCSALTPNANATYLFW